MGGGERIPRKRKITHEGLGPLVNEMRDTVYHIQSNHQLPRNSLRIWLPVYFNTMVRRYLEERYGPAAVTPPNAGIIDEFQGIKVLDGYRNNIVIGHLHCVEMDIRPVMIIIP